jgi:hypothetical protein
VKTTRSRLVKLGAMLATVLLAAACEDPFNDDAQLQVVEVQLEAWALTGSPPSFPAGLLVAQHTVIPTDAGGSFDVAFDIDADGRLRVLPVNLVVSPLSGNRSIGLIKRTDLFQTILDAPRAGWVYDEELIVNPGESFLVRVQTPYCQFQLRQDVYAKFFVAEVDPVQRRVVLTGRVNPNCGFRSFAPGIPEY